MTTTGSLRGLLTARDVNSFRPATNTLGTDSSAAGAPIPIAFGNVSVPGIISLSGENAGGDGIFRVFWCHGEVYQIDDVFINDAPLPATVEVRHYRGTIHQGIDDLVESITSLPSYFETMVKDNPAGLSAVAYSVFRIPSGAISGAPRFQAIIRGSVVYDVRKSLVSDFIFDDVQGYNLDFTQTVAGTPTTGVDLSANALTVAWSGNAQTTGVFAQFDGTGDYMTLQDVAAADFGTGKWTLEIALSSNNSIGIHYIFSKGDAASDRAIILSIISNDLYVSMSSTGTTWDIASAALVEAGAFASSSKRNITIEYTEREYHFYIDGLHVHVIQDDAPLFATTRPVRLGLYDGATATDGLVGFIYGCRLDKTINRYGGVHGNIYTSPVLLPYMDSDNIKPGYVYSATPALALGELARNPHYGLGVTSVYNELEAIEFNEELLPSAVARAEFGLVLSSVRGTEDWMDLVATYAECFWYFLDDGIYIKPDRLVTAKRPAGWEMGEDGELYDDAAWTVGTGWTHFGGDLNLFSAAAGSASAVSQAMVKPFEAGVTYTAIMDVGLRSAGTVGLTLSGITLIAPVSAAGRYAYEFIATGGEDGLILSCNKDSSFVGLIGEITIKRKYWPETSIVRGSLSISGQPNSDSPTSVQVQYTTPSATSANWLDAVTTAQMPGVDVGDIPILKTNIEFRGVQRVEEAENKALSRLLRLQNMVAVSWVSTDIGIAFRRGYVVDVTDPETATSVMVLVDSVTATNDAGRYRVTGMRYDESHYPSETVLPAATIPVGAITISRDGVVPSGWAAFTAANGKWIKGAGVTITAETTGGASTLAALTGNTTTAGEHGTDADYLPLYIDGFTETGGSGSGFLYTATEEAEGDHDHTYDTGTITPQPYSIENVLVQKITSTSTTMPGNLLAFGKAGLTSRNTTRWLYAAGRLLKAAAAAAASGIKEQAITLVTGSHDDTHEHYTRSATSSGTPSVTAAYPNVYEYVNGGSNHTHPATIGLVQNIKRYRLPLYGATDDYGLEQGHMLMWPDDPLPANWSLCNGLLGTPDLEDYFLELAAMGEEDTVAGDNTLEVFGYTNYEAHTHKGALDTASYNPLALSHQDSIKHRHVIYSAGHAWQPPWYALSMIMYNPNPVPGYRDALLLISGGEADGSTTIVDDSTHARTATVTGGTGTLQYDDSQLLFDMTTINTTAHKIYYSTLSLPTKFTVEGFFRLSTVSSGDATIMSNLGAGAGTFLVRFSDSTNTIRLQVDGALRKTGIVVAADEWFYVSVSYDNAAWYFHTGLVSTGIATLAEGSAFAQASNVMDAGFYVGSNTSAGTMRGHFSQIRVTGGVAMNTNSAIVIPQAPFATA